MQLMGLMIEMPCKSFRVIFTEFHVIVLLTFGLNKLRTRAPWTALADAF